MSAIVSRYVHDTEVDGATSASAARVVLPLVHTLTPFKSVVDVGCGLGGWLQAARECGADEVLGIDGHYVDRSRLLVAPESFLAHDLETTLDINRRFDLAISMEVAEHLSEDASDSFVALLCKLAPVVLFSAALPHQPGWRHVNCHWPAYWRRRFADHGYVALDAVRGSLLGSPTVPYYYRQATYLYVEDSAIGAYPALQESPRVPEYQEEMLMAPAWLIDAQVRASLRPRPLLSYYARRLIARVVRL